jgi:hypothetical protein
MKLHRTLCFFKYSQLNLKNQKPISVDDFLRPIQWYHSHADLIWPDGTFKLCDVFFLPETQNRAEHLAMCAAPFHFFQLV